MVKRIYIKKLPEINKVNESWNEMMNSFPEAKEIHEKNLQKILNQINQLDEIETDSSLILNNLKPMGLIKIGLFYNEIDLIVEGIQRGGKIEPFFFLIFDNQNNFYQAKCILIEKLLKIYQLPVTFQYFFLDRIIFWLYNLNKNNMKELEKIKTLIKIVKLLVIEGKSKINCNKFLLPLIQFSPFRQLKFLKKSEQLKLFFEIKRLFLYFNLPKSSP